MSCSRPMCVVWILLSCSAVVFGQPPAGLPGMPPPGSGGPSFDHGQPGSLPLTLLATQKSVQTDLKLDQTQKQRIQALDAKLRGAMGEHRPEPPDFRDKGAKPELPNFSAGAAGPGPPGRGMEKELAEILSEKQLARLNQIALQLEGPHALLAPNAPRS